jgi:hypothetical protein
MLSAPHFDSPTDRVEVLLVELTRRLVWVREQLRLTFGGEPYR